MPKGPSLDPGEKRLAVHVEDHPLDYGEFEGVIPEGEYGGGTVLLWDRGIWVPLNSDPEAAYRKGSLKFTLKGEKLHGNWALVRMGGKAANERHENWLLIKERDEEAVPQSGDAVVADNPLSVASGRSMDAIAADRDWVWHSNRDDNEKRAGADHRGARHSRRSQTPDARQAAAAARDPCKPGAGRTRMAARDQIRRIPPARPHRGRRCSADHSRRSRLDRQIPGARARLGQLPLDLALIDGELVHLEPEGTTSFSSLQDAISGGKTDTLNFFAFDLLYRDGWDLTGAALEDRKAALAEIIPPNQQGMLRYSDHQIGRGPAFLSQACNFALEGIVSKRRTEPYRPGRSRSWLKSKCRNREEFVIVGFTDPEGSREGFGALLVGYYDPQGKLRYAGRVGTGFNTGQLIQLHRQLESLARPDPTVALPKGISRKGVHWIEPRLVAEVEFATWTADAILRQASFQGLREDKDASDVVYDPKTRTTVEPAAKPKKDPARPKQAASKKAETDEPPRARDGSLNSKGSG